MALSRFLPGDMKAVGLPSHFGNRQGRRGPRPGNGREKGVVVVLEMKRSPSEVSFDPPDRTKRRWG